MREGKIPNQSLPWSVTVMCQSHVSGSHAVHGPESTETAVQSVATFNAYQTADLTRSERVLDT